jgi:hypothetical protein
MQATTSRVQFLGRLVVAGAFALLVAGSGRAEAAEIFCPPDPTLDQLHVEYTVGTIECADWSGGPGNVTGWATPPEFPNAADGDLIYEGNSYPLIGDVSAGSGSAGTLALPLGDYLVLFKFGGGQNNPDWVIIGLDDSTGGSWDYSGPNGLSHVTVWGDPGTPQIPEPASLLLIGTGLVGAAAAKRRAAKKA